MFWLSHDLFSYETFYFFHAHNNIVQWYIVVLSVYLSVCLSVYAITSVILLGCLWFFKWWYRLCILSGGGCPHETIILNLYWLIFSIRKWIKLNFWNFVSGTASVMLMMIVMVTSRETLAWRRKKFNNKITIVLNAPHLVAYITKACRLWGWAFGCNAYVYSSLHFVYSSLHCVYSSMHVCALVCICVL